MKKTSYFSRKTIALLSLIGCFMLLGVYSSKKTTIDIQLSIYNSFTGSSTIGPVEYIGGSGYYTCTPTQDIIVSASTGSTRVIQGDVENLVAGSDSGMYTNTGTVALDGSIDGTKIIQVEFFKGIEVLTIADLFVILDTAPPSEPILIYPWLGLRYNNSSVYFERSNSNDTSSGFKEYVLTLSNSATFHNPKKYTTTQTSLSIDRNLIGYSNVYRRVEAWDNTCNKSVSLPSFFKLQGVNSNNDNNNNNNNDDDSSSNPPPNSPLSPPTPDDPGTRYVPHTYTKDTFTPLTSLKDFYRDKNIDVVLAGKKKQVFEEHFSGAENPYQQIVMPGYLQKTGADPATIIRQIEILASIATLEQRRYLYSIIHQLLPNWTSGMILLVLMLMYDVEIYRKWYDIRLMQKKRQHKFALLT